LSDKLAFVPPVIDLAPHGFLLLGARLDYLDDRAVAALVYRRRQHHINLWIAPAGAAPATTGTLATRHGYHVMHWVHADMAWLFFTRASCRTSILALSAAVC
jgi:anti-sigma factor RsiW